MAPAEAVYAVHDALPNLLWGLAVLYVPCTEPAPPPKSSSTRTPLPSVCELYTLLPRCITCLPLRGCDARGRGIENLTQPAVHDPRIAHCAWVLT